MISPSPCGTSYWTSNRPVKQPNGMSLHSNSQMQSPSQVLLGTSSHPDDGLSLLQQLPGRRSRPNTRGGREATGPEEEGPRPTSSLAKGPYTESMPEAKTRTWNPLLYRADRPTKGRHKDTPRPGRKLLPRAQL